MCPALAYRALNIAATGTKEQIKAIGDPPLLPGPGTRPPAAKPNPREEVWVWQGDVVTWLNREYVWDVAGVILGAGPSTPTLCMRSVLADSATEPAPR